MSTLLILILVVAIAVTLRRGLPPNNCTGNCNQGRNCNCRGQ